MFCFQCEQTAKGTGCDKIGVCGKTPETAAIQDLLVHTMKGFSLVALEAAKHGAKTPEDDHFACQAIFSTLTNVDFDPERFTKLMQEAETRMAAMKEKITAKGGNTSFPQYKGSYKGLNTAALIAEGEKTSFKAELDANVDITSLRQLLIYGIKGVAAYADHAAILGKTDQAVYDFLYEGMAATLDNTLGVNELVGLVLKCGEINLKAMELLDAGNTGTYGHPVPTSVPLGTKKGKAILVSGHDLKDMYELLKQTEGKGINIYTHGEMLPTHAYPELKKFSHFFGHYGTAWQNQAKEFDEFPGAILMTTNCIQKPKETYKDHIFTTGLVGWPGVEHIASKDFSPVIKKALDMPGFAEDKAGASVMVGFARNTVLGVADKVIEGVKSKAIRHFFLVGGCDGAKPGRNYYTEFVEKVPKDCMILTLACGKFRFFDKQLGDIGGIPRLLDVGQCNDAYSAVQIAVALAGAFECGVNDLPLSFILSWYEQKAVAILLTLLFLGIKDIRLGPSLPAFLSPNVIDVLVKNFNIMPIKTADEDLKAILG
ncbi:hydroxylamine reductase [Desulforegula conservatrix]|uniref:hydroxylamine reductase n=1 Tax=Desulforegula conservatrix TaxID=153026 RepID=UPI0003FB733A|nr:hydroxylamine reductase [Desulforegula conservatrix]